MMGNPLYNFIDRLQKQTEFGLVIYQRYMLAMIICAGIFTGVMFPVVHLMVNPIQFLKADYKFVNTLELAETIPNQAADHNLNGTLQGASLGVTVCQGIPIIGLPLGILLGGYIGHRVDESF